MRNRLIQAFCAAAAIVFVLISTANPVFCASPDDEAEKIVSYRLKSLGYDDIQGFIDGWLTERAGISEADWFACALARRGSFDFSAYNIRLAEHASDGNPSERLRNAVSALMTGGSVDAEAVLRENYGKLGIMSEIYGLHLMKLSGIGDTDRAVADLLARQLSDGGWALSGNVSDPDVTAMALQALAGMNGCESAVNAALNRLSALQQDDGGYKSFGNSTSESCAQVIAALSSLGIDPLTDPRFVKSGKTTFDALLGYKTASGGFSHLQGGKANQTATVQALIALTSMEVGNFYEPYAPTPTENTSPTTTAASEEIPQETEVSVVEVTLPNGNVMTGSAVTEEQGGAEEAVTTAAKSEEAVDSADEILSTQVESVDEKTENTSENPLHTEVSALTETTVTAEAVLTVDNNNDSSSQPWKVAAVAVIAVGWGGCLLFLFARKNLSIGKAIGGTIAASVCVCVVLVTKIQTPEEYYSRHIDDIRPDSLTFSMTVSTEQLGDKGHAIVPETDFVLIDGETAFSALERVLAYKKVALDYSGSVLTDVYIRGIDGVYEFEHGEMSGWMYRVNGDFPSVGCGNYVLHDGDRVEFLYTTNIGRDIGAEEYTK